MARPPISSLIERGLRRPRKIPRYVFGSLVPSAEWGATWRKREGVVRFEPGGYATSPRDRPEFGANLYNEVAGLRDVLADHSPGPAPRALEVGCGYGRLAPWIAAETGSYLGVDPDGGAVRRAGTLYPDLDFALGRAEALPVRDDTADLVVTWTVLQHVPEATIGEAAAEIRRVLAPDGLVVACERVRPPADDHLRPRPPGRYAELFDSLEPVESRPRPVEPTWSRTMGSERPPERLLVFRG